MSDLQPVIGINIRSEASGRSARLGLLPRQAHISVKNRKGDWGQIDRIIKGEIAPVRPGEPVAPAAAHGWVYLPEMDAGPKQPPKLGEVVVPETPIPINAGALIGHMGEYQQYVDAQAVPRRGIRPLLHLEVFAGDELPDFIAQSRRYASLQKEGSETLFVVDAGAHLRHPAEPDGLLPAGTMLMELKDSGLSPWVKVQRCELRIMDRASLGTYSAQDKNYANFKEAQYTGFFIGATAQERTQSATVAKEKGYNRRELKFPIAMPFWVLRKGLESPPAGGMKTWTRAPLRLDGPRGSAVGMVRIFSRADLERTKLQYRALDEDGNGWWRISTRAETPGMLAHGWVCEKGHDKVGWKSPWMWPGFETLEESGAEPVDLFTASLLKLGALRKEEVQQFQMRADKVEKSVLIRKLHEQLDTNRNGHISKAEMLAASRQPMLLQALSRLIVRYESEWGGADDKWNALDPLMLDGTPEWQAEKIRIGQLRWWADVAGKVNGFPTKPDVYHLHPIGILSNFHSPLRVQESNDDGVVHKSGADWHSKFPASRSIADLVEPFQSNVRRFVAALEAGGVKVTISNTLRPPQRSYLMYYAKEISDGLSPDKVPPFEPQNGDAPVRIDWLHLNELGQPDMAKAKEAARLMHRLYRTQDAVAKPYRSNHNRGDAIDMRFDPGWGLGKTVVDASGASVLIGGKRGIISVGHSFGVVHWNHAGEKRKKDDPHWSATGN